MTHTKDKKEEWEKKLAEIGFIHPPLIVFIKNLLKQNRQQLIDEVVAKCELMKKIWICGECAYEFTDKEKDNEEDNRCPHCKVMFEQLPYEAPHHYTYYDIIKNGESKHNQAIEEITKLLVEMKEV